MSWLMWAGSAQAQVNYFFSLKYGAQDTSLPAPGLGEGADYLDTVADEHGKLKNDQIVRPYGFSFDFYSNYGPWSTGFGFEWGKYTKFHKFQDKTKVNVQANSIFFYWSTYVNADWVLPYFSWGTGNYNVKIHEKLQSSDPNQAPSGASFHDSATNVWFYEFGGRFPLGDWGLLLSWRAISGRLKLDTNGEKIELGGRSYQYGAYYTW